LRPLSRQPLLEYPKVIKEKSKKGCAELRKYIMCSQHQCHLLLLALTLARTDGVHGGGSSRWASRSRQPAAGEAAEAAPSASVIIAARG
jgi:hypothetical protein